MPTVVGVFEQPLGVAAVARRLRDRGFSKLEVYSPVPSHELDRCVEPGPSKVRWFTLIGGLTGVVTGYLMTIWMAQDWQLPVGGKPYASVPPYTIIAFELTILFGGLMTFLGLLLVGILPWGFGRSARTYDPRFSAEDFGLIVQCQERDVPEIDALLRAHGAKEVKLVDA
jgi:hypothetical protein